MEFISDVREIHKENSSEFNACTPGYSKGFLDLQDLRLPFCSSGTPVLWGSQTLGLLFLHPHLKTEFSILFFFLNPNILKYFQTDLVGCGILSCMQDRDEILDFIISVSCVGEGFFLRGCLFCFYFSLLLILKLY